MTRRTWMQSAVWAVLAVAGAGSAAAPDAGQSLTIWWAKWAPADGLAELGQQFQQETGIAVKVQQIPWTDYQTQVFKEFAARSPRFDIVIGDSQWIGRGATKNLYLDLTDWLPTAVDLKTQHPLVLKYLCEYPAGSGKYYAAPCESDAIGFAYRKDWFEDPAEQAAFQAKYKRPLAVPQTWAEFRDVAEFFHRPDQKRYGCALLTGRGYDSLTMGFQQLMYAWGGSWGDAASGKAEGFVNSAGSVEALAFFKSLLAFAPAGGANFEYNQTLEAFTNGSTAMSMNYFAFAPGIVKELGPKAGFFVIPRHGERRAVSLGGQGFSISRKASPAQQALAKRFIAWFLQKKIQEQWVTKPAGFTANVEILASPAFRQATPYNGPLAESMDHMQDFWNVPSYNELLAVAQRCLGEALDGVKSPKDALDALAREQQAILAEGRE